MFFFLSFYFLFRGAEFEGGFIFPSRTENQTSDRRFRFHYFHASARLAEAARTLGASK